MAKAKPKKPMAVRVDPSVLFQKKVDRMLRENQQHKNKRR